MIGHIRKLYSNRASENMQKYNYKVEDNTNNTSKYHPKTIKNKTGIDPKSMPKLGSGKSHKK